MADLGVDIDLDHCLEEDCRVRLPYFERTVARQRAEPRRCWSCERKRIPPKEALHHRVAARQPTVLRLHQLHPSPDPAA